MNGEMILFLVVAFFAVLSAVGTITMRNPIRAAMCLLAHIVVLAALYVGLHAHLLAALQLIVYAGAIVVLFIFVIMLIGPTTVKESGGTGGLMSKLLATVMMVIMGVGVAFAVMAFQPTTPVIAGCPAGSGPECNQFGGVMAFAQELYVRSVVPFELISVLLLVAIVGAIAVARGRNAAEGAALKRGPAGAADPSLEPSSQSGR